MNQKKKITIILTSVGMLAILIISLLFVFCRVIPNRKEEDARNLAMKQYRNAKISRYIEENENYDDYEVDVAFPAYVVDAYDVGMVQACGSLRLSAEVFDELGVLAVGRL